MTPLPLPVFLLVLKLLGRRRRFESAQGMHRAAVRESRAPAAAPPAKLRQRVRIDCRLVAGYPCYTLASLRAAGAQRMLYLHGGGHMAQISTFHWAFLARLVEATGCTVDVPLYPRAPQYTHRDALPVALQCYRELAAAHAADQLVLMGDSSGGGFALLLAQRLAGEGLPQPREIVLISPWLDLAVSHPGIAALEAHDPWLARPGMVEAGRWWAGGDDPALPQLNPLNAPLAGLGRLSIFIGTRDLLWADCRLLQERALAQGVALQLHEAAGQIHVWPLLPVPGARQAQRTIADLVRGDNY